MERGKGQGSGIQGNSDRRIFSWAEIRAIPINLTEPCVQDNLQDRGIPIHPEWGKRASLLELGALLVSLVDFSRLLNNCLEVLSIKGLTDAFKNISFIHHIFRAF